MSVSISTTTECHGAWINHHKGDVHAYVNPKEQVVVIGTNKSYKDKIEFTDLAIVIGADKCYLQYECNGKCEQIDVPESVVKDRILSMLGEIKADMVVK